MKVTSIGGNKLSDWIEDKEDTNKIQETDIVVFGGGPDITPSFYNEARLHPLTNSSLLRDKSDRALIAKSIGMGKLTIGICRSAQLLTALAGGKVIQHVNGHATGATHGITTIDGNTFDVTSTHHQMMYPYSANEYKILAKSSVNLSDVYFKNDVQVYEMIEEPEVVWYPKIKALAIQPHPEFMDDDCNFHKWLNKLIKKYVI